MEICVFLDPVFFEDSNTSGLENDVDDEGCLDCSVIEGKYQFTFFSVHICTCIDALSVYNGYQHYHTMPDFFLFSAPDERHVPWHFTLSNYKGSRVEKSQVLGETLF